MAVVVGDGRRRRKKIEMCNGLLETVQLPRIVFVVGELIEIGRERAVV
jgi:hypothetical protein